MHRRAGSPATDSRSPRSLRLAYLEWVEEQVEDYKDSVSRSELLRLAEEVVEELRVSRAGQYQLTEVLLCEAVDRRIARLLKLPGYRAWAAKRRGTRPIEISAPAPPAEEPRAREEEGEPKVSVA